MPTKEQIYDEQISPLISQVIAICKEHKIANVMSFSLDPSEGLCCTTAMTTDEFEPPEEFKKCVGILYRQQSSPLMMTVKDESGSVKEMHAIFPVE